MGRIYYVHMPIIDSLFQTVKEPWFFRSGNNFEGCSMPRPKKPRQCGCRMAGRVFKPSGTPMAELRKIFMAPDELEALKLCDQDGLFQAQAAEKMGVSRGTVQRLLASGRKKVARALVEGDALVMEGSGDCEE